MNLLSIQSKFNGIAGSCGCTRIYTSGYVSALNIEVQEYFCTKQLIYTDGGLDHSLRRLLQPLVRIMYILRTDTKNNGLSVVAAIDEFLSFCRSKFDGMVAYLKSNVVAAYFNGSIQEVHLRRTDESSYEQVARIVVKVLRGIYLLNNTIFHNYDSGTKGHSLCLVMCNVNDGCAQSLMQFGDLNTHLYTKFCIQV